MSRTDVVRRPTKEDVFSSTNNGLEIYKRWVPTLERKGDRYIGLCPFHNERSGSFQVFGPRNSYKCFGCGEGGVDALKFLQEKEGISFMQALEMAASNFSVSHNPIYTSYKPVEVKEKMVIDFVDMPFKKEHKAYWNKYLLPESYLRSKNVFAVEKWAINGRVQSIGEEEIVFAYLAEDIDETKILRIGPHVDKKQKWKNTVPNEYIWDFPKKKVEELWIIKSRKDSFCMEYHFGKTSTALQNESANLLLEFNYDRIEQIADRKVVCMGSDDQGWHESYLLTHLTDWEYFNSPNYMLQYGVQDIADVIAEFGTGVIEKDLIKKGYL